MDMKPAEDFQSGVESRSKQPSIEKQMQMPNLDNFEFPVNEASMMFTPGHSGILFILSLQQRNH